MKAWQQRVFEEQAELNVRIGKLHAFLYSDVEIGPIDYILLVLQLRAMQTYSNILECRIQRFQG